MEVKVSMSLRLPGNGYSENVPEHYLSQPKRMKAEPTGRTNLLLPQVQGGHFLSWRKVS